jgi:phosphoribosyl-AMP cyclohydrolase / phosphoribosyl-ATP pyrophosphohydrolase
MSTAGPSSMALTDPAPLWGPSGLLPAIIQDVRDGRVLMLAWMDDESLRVTRETGIVHFHSRSRDRLWRKGETSGHELRLVDLALDCDADAILVQAEPVGPTCHRGTRSCFDAEGASAGTQAQGLAWLETLWATIASRASERPDGSYTVALLDGGVDAVGRKVTEEATEVLIAAKDAAAAGTGARRESAREALTEEAADLVFHLLALLAEREIRPADVVDVLRARHGG